MVCFWCWLLIRIYYLTPYSNSKLIVDATKKSDKTSTSSPSNEDPAGIHVSSDNFHHSMVDISGQIAKRSYSSELSQSVETYGEHLSGTYYSKI